MWAREQNGLAAEITAIDPAGRYHAEVPWHPCAPTTAVGDVWNGSAFVPPVVIGPAPATRIISSNAFMNLFTPRRPPPSGRPIRC